MTRDKNYIWLVNESFVYQRMENKFNSIQGLPTLVKFLEVQWCGVCRDVSSKLKDKLLHLIPLTTKTGTRPRGTVWIFGSNTFFTWVCYFGPFTMCLVWKVTSFETDSEQEKAPQQAQMGTIWSSRSNVTWGVCGEIGKLCETSGRPHKWLLRFWNKVLLPFADSYSSFEKQFLARYCDLLETGHLIMGISLPCALSCSLWTGYYLIHQLIKLSVHSNSPSLNRSNIYKFEPEQVLKVEVIWRSFPSSHGFYSCYTSFFLPASTYILREYTLWSVEGGREA